MKSIIEFITPAAALMILEENVCKRCTVDNHPNEDELIVYDICRSESCPVTKLHKAVGFRAHLSYTYSPDEEINPYITKKE